MPRFASAMTMKDFASIQDLAADENGLYFSNGGKLYKKRGTVVTEIATGSSGFYEPAMNPIIANDNTGQSQWLYTRYSMPGAPNGANVIPTLEMLAGRVGDQSIVGDQANLVMAADDNYMGHLRTMMYVSVAKSFNITLTHDDGAQFYVNGVSIYSAPVVTTGVVVTFSLRAGWNIVDLLWAEQAGGDGINAISPLFSTQVEIMRRPETQRAMNANDLLYGTVGNQRLPARLRADMAQNGVSDVNQAFESGTYYFDGTSNGPGVGDSHLYVSAYNSQYVTQLLVPLHSDRMFFRRRDNGTWSAWKELANNDKYIAIPFSQVGGIISDIQLPARLKVTGDQNIIGDWNAAVFDGYFASFADGSNAPFNGTWMGHVYTYDSGQVVQTITQLHVSGRLDGTDSAAWRRVRQNGTWGSWYRVDLTYSMLDARYMPIGAQFSAIGGSIGNLQLPARLQSGANNVPAGNDWNNATDSGWYSGTGLTNAPPGITGWFQVRVQQLAANPAYVYQEGNAAALGTGVKPGVSWKRIKDNGSWSAWSQVEAAAVHDINSHSGVIDDTHLPSGQRSSGIGSQITDWNNATTSGLFVGVNAANGPTVEYYTGRVETQDGNWLRQTVWCYTKQTWQRERQNGAWTPWVRLLVTQDELDTRYASLGIYNTDRDSLRDTLFLTGGGEITYDSSNVRRLKWTQRFIPMATRGSSYYDIVMPAVGTTIYGLGSRANNTVTADGILLTGWETLFYNRANGNFYVGTYNQGGWAFDPNHVFVATASGDTGALRLCTGQTIGGGISASSYADPYRQYLKRTENVSVLPGTVADSQLPGRLRAGGVLANNMSTITESGWYVTPPTDSGGTSRPDQSDATQWILSQYQGDASNGRQYGYALNGGYSDSKEYYRRRVNGAWQGWDVALLTRTELDARFAQKANVYDKTTSDGRFLRFDNAGQVSNRTEFQSTQAGNDWGYAGLTTRSSVGHPSLAFHYPNNFAHQLRLNRDTQRFQFVDQAGTSLMPLDVSDITIGGRVPFVGKGAYGAGNDFNGFSVPGSYQINDHTSLTNGPPTEVYHWGVLVVTNTGDCISQTFYPHDNNQAAWYRVCWFGDWRVWSKLLGLADLDLKANVYHLHDASDINSGILASARLPYPIRMTRKDTAINLNTGPEATANGFWAAAPGSQNTPEGAGNSNDWWHGWTLMHDPSQGNLWVTQYAQNMTGGNYVDSIVYMRRCRGNNWGSWQKTMLTKDEMDATYAQATGNVINDSALPPRLRGDTYGNQLSGTNGADSPSLKTGYYGWTNAGAAFGLPSTWAAFLHVFDWQDQWVAQEAHVFDVNKTFRRRRLNSTGQWTPWLESLQSDIQLDGTYNMGNGVTQTGVGRYAKTIGSAGWDGHLYSVEGYENNVSFSCEVEDVGSAFMVGLNSDPTTNPSFDSIDFAWYKNSGTWGIYENGAAINSSVASIAVNDVVGISYNNSIITYTLNGRVVRSVIRSSASKLYFDSSFYSVSSTGIKNLKYGLNVEPKMQLSQEFVQQSGTPNNPDIANVVLYAKTDGRLWVKNNVGQEYQLAIGADASAHGNPGFEVDNSGKPNLWGDFWGTGTRALSRDTTDYLFGTASAKVVCSVSSSLNLQSNTIFNVSGGQRIDIVYWAKAVGPTPKITAMIQTAPSGDPDFFGATTVNTYGAAEVPLPQYNRYTTSLIVPAGHTRARITFACDAQTGGAATFNIDGTGSTLGPVPAPDSGWLNFPGAGGWTAYGNGWSTPQYRRIADIVYVKGLLSRSSGGTAAAGSAIGNLPTGYRPVANSMFYQGIYNPGVFEGVGRVDVGADGNVYCQNSAIGQGGYINLDRIYFFAV